jgi:hypothetical protein
LRSLVKEYVLVKGNRESTEALQDYVKYLHQVGYVIRRQPKRKPKLP